MAERKAVNKYYPPEWTPGHGSINKYRGSHPLRERARKLHMGILVIRFEMPYNIWCEGCGNHIGTGVRYNAEKSKVGMYYTTPVYKFRMKCHLCDSHFEMQTDPQNLDYIILNGARRQERRWDPQENEQVAPEDKDVSKKLATDAMFRLEHSAEDKEKVRALVPSFAKMEEFQDRWKDDYSLNKLLRKKFRETKKELQKKAEKDKSLLMKSSLDINLLPETSEDKRIAELLTLTPVQTFDEKQKQKRDEIFSRPIFNECENSTSAKSRIIQAVQKQKFNVLTKSLTSSDLGIVKKSEEISLSIGEVQSTVPSSTMITDTDTPVESTPSMNASVAGTSLVSVDYCSSSDDET